MESYKEEEEKPDLFKLFSAYCYKKYKVMVNMNNNQGGNYNICFSSLTKIDNIKVRSRLRIPCSSHCNHMIFEVRDKFSPFKHLFTYSCSFERGDNNEFSEYQVGEMIRLINDLVPRLKFDKLTGCLQEYIEPFGNHFIDGEQCCVCYELTMTKTKMCNHYICRSCFQQLRQSFICPICRTRSQLDTDTDLEFSEQTDDEDDED